MKTLWFVAALLVALIVADIAEARGRRGGRGSSRRGGGCSAVAGQSSGGGCSGGMCSTH